VDTYEFEPDALQASHRLKTLLSLQVAHYLVASFVKGEAPPSARLISHELEIPIRLVNEILFALVNSNIVSATEADKDGERGFLPARDINTITIQYVIEAMEKRGLNDMPFAHTPEYEAISETMASFEDSLEKLPANKLIKDI